MQTMNKVGESRTTRMSGVRKVLRVVMWSLVALVSAVVLMLVAAVAWLGPLAEWVVEDNDKALVGRHLTMDNLRVKLFEGVVTAENVLLYEADDTTNFVRLGSVVARLDMEALFDEHIFVREVSVKAPVARIEQNGDIFNFDDLLEFIDVTYLAEDDAEDGAEDGDWRVTIANVSIAEGDFCYYDKVLEQRWQLTELALIADELKLGDEFTDIAAHAMINDRALLDGDLSLNIDNYDFKFDGTLEEFPLAETMKYVTPYLNVSDFQGLASGDVVLEGNVLDIMSMDIYGDLAVQSLSVTDEDGKNLLKAESLMAKVEQMNINKELYLFETLTAKNYATRFIFNADGSTNFDTLFVSDPEVSTETQEKSLGEDMYSVTERVTVTTKEEVAPMQNMVLRIGELSLTGGYVEYADMTMHEPFNYNLSGVNISSRNFDLKTKNRVRVRGRLPKQGSMLMVWEGSLSDFYNQSLLATLTNIDMPALSTFVEYYTAYPVESGNFTFRSQNIVTNGRISGVNQLGTYNLQVGKKNKKLKPEHAVPLRLGVYLLTDKDDHIDVDLPITGNIDSPEFSLRRVIFRAIGNLLLKIVAAPFSWMAPNKQDAFQSFEVDMLTPTLDSEQYAHLDRMAEEIKKEPTTKVRLTQRVNYSRAVRDIADLNLKMAYYNATQVGDGERIDMLDIARISDMRLSNKGVVAFADSMLLARGISPAHMNNHAKAMTLYGDYVDNQLKTIMERRNRIVSDYLKFQHPDLPVDAIVLGDVDMKVLRGQTGKSRYAVTLIIDDQEYDVEAGNRPEDEEESVTEEIADNKVPDEKLVESGDAASATDEEDKQTVNNQ